MCSPVFNCVQLCSAMPGSVQLCLPVISCVCLCSAMFSCVQHCLSVFSCAPLGQTVFWSVPKRRINSAGILVQFMGARNRVGIGLMYRLVAGYIGWRNRFLGIYSWDPLTFKNTVSGSKTTWITMLIRSMQIPIDYAETDKIYEFISIICVRPSSEVFWTLFSRH